MICWYLVGRGDGSKTCQSDRTAGLVVGAGWEVKDLLSRMDPDVSLSVGLHRGRSWRRRCRVRRRTQAWEGTGLFHQIPGGYLVLIVAGHQIYKQFLCIFCQGHCWLVRMGLAILSTESNRVFSLLAVPYSAQFSASVLLYSSYAIATQHQVLGTTIIWHLSQQSYRNFPRQDLLARNDGNNKERNKEWSEEISPGTDGDDATKSRIAADLWHHSHPSHYSISILCLLAVINDLKKLEWWRNCRVKKLPWSPVHCRPREYRG